MRWMMLVAVASVVGACGGNPPAPPPARPVPAPGPSKLAPATSAAPPAVPQPAPPQPAAPPAPGSAPEAKPPEKLRPGDDTGSDAPGTGDWCGTGRMGGDLFRLDGAAGQAGWSGPDKQGVWRFRAWTGGPKRTEKGLVVLPRRLQVTRYGTYVGSRFHESRPGESLEDFLARLKREAAAKAAEAGKKK